MLPKWSIRPRRLRARRFGVLTLLVLVGAAPVVWADGGTVPVPSTKAPRAQVGVPLKSSIAVAGGAAPYRFEVVAGALPVGLGIAKDGTISGTPTAGGPFRFTLRVTDSSSAGTSALQSYVMYVESAVDPGLDPSTVALLTQQATIVRRYALAQIGNYQTRLQALRADSAGRCTGDERRPALASAGSSGSGTKDGLPYQPPQPDESFNLPVDNCRTLADRSTTLWTAGALNFGTVRDPAGSSAFRFDSQGVTLGGDYGLKPNLSFGAGVGIAGDESRAVPIGGTSSTSYGTTVAGYVSYRPLEQLYLDAVFGAGDVALDSTRATFSGSEAYGTRRADQRFFSVSAGQRLATGDWQLVPYTRVDHVRATLRSFDESGAADALNFSQERVPSLKVVAGATAETSVSTRIGTVLPRTSIEYRRELERSDPALLRRLDDPNGVSYAVLPAAMERDSTTLGLGANLLLANRWSFGLNGSVNRSTTSGWSRIDAMLTRVF
jgi:outer membrane autotransporter protein